MNDSKKKFKSKEFNKVLKLDDKEYQVYIPKELELNEINNSQPDKTEKEVDAQIMPKSDTSKEEVKDKTKSQTKKIKLKLKKGVWSPYYEFSQVDGKDVGTHKVGVAGASTFYWWFWATLFVVIMAVIGAFSWIVWALVKQDQE
ncbi:MAG: hypothetical protein MRERC_1c102 [Mycoplasmataceae bacterium RC_NB112A]|nr:MAG: hypothetical protein MRERC_1c102 [Mycoplasmataceae bacterium RC_NB112A]